MKMKTHDENVHSMTMRFMLTVLFVLGMTITANAIAQATGVDASVVAPTLVNSAEKIGWISGLLTVALQIAKSDLLGGFFAKIDKAYQPAVILLLGQLGALVESVASGKKLGQAAIEWLISSGNAMALYTVVFKPFTKKKKE